jgi:Tol biopolymer transport system component
LVRYELASGAVRDLPASQTATSPRHKPDSSAVIYLDRGALAITQTDGDAPPQRLIQAPPLLAPAAYSPDGQFIYAARQAGNRWDLWRWRSDGSQPTPLTVSDPLAAQPANHVAPAASPDGRSVAFLTDRAGRWELWVMASDGTNPRPLAPGTLAGITFRYDFNADRTVDWGP